ncbi:hypothetical protein Q9L58_005896 [Maublancomyces gigas]|uniref:Uncharacterized protein n=1 Tax=Discina gigas TaxID=1032678 RepID=A0ABR3GHY0_9PEZI
MASSSISTIDADEKEKLDQDFVRAAEIGDTNTVRMLLSLGADIEFRLAPRPGIFSDRTIFPEVKSVRENRGYDINGQEIHLSDRTALQAAADGSHGDVLRLLVDSGADINPGPPRRWGKSALQGAVDCEDESLVKLLLHKGENANGHPSQCSGFTPLQGAALKGNEELVILLLASGADVNAPAHQLDGKTALEAALESENQWVVQILVQAGADHSGQLLSEWLSDAVRRRRGERVKLLLTLKPDDVALGTALNNAVRLGDQKMVELLLDAMATAPVPILTASAGSPVVPIMHPGFAVKDRFGDNILHISCRLGHIDLVRFLLTIATQDVLDARNHAGATVLHAAVSTDNLPMLKLLMDSGVNLESKDRSGKSALRVALDYKRHNMSSALLQRGAKTDGLPLGLARMVLSVFGSPHIEGWMLLLQSGSANGMHLSGVSANAMWVDKIDDKIWTLPSFCFAGYCLPPTFIPDSVWQLIYSYLGARVKARISVPLTDPKREICDAVVLSTQLSRNWPQRNNGNLEMVVFLVTYFRFGSPGQVSGNGSRAANTVARRHDLQPFKTINTRVQISWIMRKEPRAKGSPVRLRSIIYRCSFRPQYLAIPADGAEFVIFFIAEIHSRWQVLFEGAMRHLGKIRDIQLIEGGKNTDMITCLLTDSQEWQTLRNKSNEHVLAMEKVVNMFRTNPVLHTEMIPEDDGTDPNRTTVPVASLARLAAHVAALKEECAQRLLKLDNQIKEMIELVGISRLDLAVGS